MDNIKPAAFDKNNHNENAFMPSRDGFPFEDQEKKHI